MSFWNYFKNTLGYPQIQRPGPLAMLAEGGAKGLDAAREKAVELRDQFVADTALAAYISLHGAGRGLKRHGLENDARYKNRVIHAYAWQRLAGRFRGMEKIFAAYGYPGIRLIELKDEYWAEFDLYAQSAGLLDEDWELAVWLANEYKRASSKLRHLRLVKTAPGFCHIKTAVLVGETIRILPLSAQPSPAKGGFKVLAATAVREHITVYPKG